MDTSDAYPTVVSLVLKRISVAGDRIGRNFDFTLRAGDLTTQFERRIRTGESAATNRVLYTATFDAAGAPITLPVQIQVLERDLTPDAGGTSTNVRLDPAVSHSEAVTVQVKGKGPRDEGKIGTVTLELVTEARSQRYRLAPPSVTPGRLQAVRVLGPRPPLSAAKYKIKGRDDKPTSLKVVRAAPIPTRLELGGVRVLLEGGAPVGVEPRSAPTSGPAAIADVAELLIWVPSDVPADTYQLLVSTADGTEALPLVVEAAARQMSRPLFEPNCAPEHLRQSVPLLPDVFPDVSFAVAAAAGPGGVEAAFAGFADRYQNVIRAELARRGVDIESARLALQSASAQVGSLGVMRRIPLPARAPGKLRVRAGAVLAPVDQSQFEQDTDADGLPDALEEALARAFQPTWRVSKRERSGTGFTRFDPTAAVRVPTDTPLANPPLVHFRVRPLGISDTGQGRFAVAQIDYLTLWNQDDGLPPRSLSLASATGTVTLALLGSELVKLLSVLTGVAIDALNEALIAHEGDEERCAVLVAAPLAAGEERWPTELSRWQAYDYYTAAHEGTISDQSCYVAPAAPIGLREPDDRIVERNVELWLSLSKHGTYHFDPDGLPLLDAAFVVVTEVVAIVTDILIDIVRNHNLDVDVVQILYELSVITTVIILVFRIIIAEQFIALPGEESPVVARALVDVGEPERPRFPWINQAAPRDLRSKFVPLWRLD